MRMRLSRTGVEQFQLSELVTLYRRFEMSTCPNCGGTMIGDGYSQVRECENLSDQEREALGVDYAAPDEGPFYCSNVE